MKEGKSRTDVEFRSNKQVSGATTGQSKQAVSTDTVSAYVQNSMAKGHQPLPILNRINEETGEMLLMHYKMNASNADSFADALKSIVPQTMKKMALIDNALTDQQISRMF
jgi:hypothetical protein